MNTIKQVEVRDLKVGDVIDTGHYETVLSVTLHANGRATLKTNKWTNSCSQTDKEYLVIK